MTYPHDARTTVKPEVLPDVSQDGRLGVYRLIREIGHGGMGTVYLGVRDDDAFQKRVAIKVLKRGMDTDSIVRRFRHERQILASLEHPFIASLLDGGSTPDGRPYFAMEYVEGQPIGDYCDTHRLDTPARLGLFRLVCTAVQYAHQNLVIHRDIKPANVLVMADGTPKLLDFGIAKLLNPELGGQTLAPTAPGLQLMTPEYASPEQVRGEAVTTASDVYSLGVLLYELLAGRLPYRITSRAQADIVRIVCESEPIRPSTAITQIDREGAGEAPPTGEPAHESGEVAKRDRRVTVDVDRLRRQLAGDLDNIVLKALSKEPQRRYASVDQFSEDVRRHLAGLPVMARKDTWGYRTTKFVRRNRAIVGAGVTTFVVLVAGVIATTWQARVARAERARAEQRFGDVRQLAHAFLFDFHDSIADLEGSTPARKLVVTKGLEYLDRLAGDAGDRVDLRREIAAAYVKVGDVQGRPVHAQPRRHRGRARQLSQGGRPLRIDHRRRRSRRSRAPRPRAGLHAPERRPRGGRQDRRLAVVRTEGAGDRARTVVGPDRFARGAAGARRELHPRRRHAGGDRQRDRRPRAPAHRAGDHGIRRRRRAATTSPTSASSASPTRSSATRWATPTRPTSAIPPARSRRSTDPPRSSATPRPSFRATRCSAAITPSPRATPPTCCSR